MAMKVRPEITEYAKALSVETPGSKEFQQDLDNLKARMAIYQSYDHAYVEVKAGKQKITMDDTAFFVIHDIHQDENNPDEIIETDDCFFIEDISYLDPMNSYKNGLFDEKKQQEISGKWGWDPVFDSAGHVGKLDNYRENGLKTAYVNRDTHTFLPGLVRVVYMDQEYEIDCTPADTKGYEKIDFAEEGGFINLLIFYREDPDLTSDDFLYVIVPDPDLDTDELEPYIYADYLNSGKMDQYAWYVGYTGPYYPSLSAFKIAPLSSAIIIVSAVALAAIAALVFAVIKYQKDKTVWKIFEYRIKTTEAMAHDLKTPLSTMMCYLDNLEESAEDPGKVREYTRNLDEKVETMDHMISDILLFSKSESGKMPLAKEKVNVKEVIGESLKEFPDIKADVKGCDTILTTDRKVFGQAITNLLSNCDRYGKKGSVVNIEITPDVLTIANKTDRTYDDVHSLKTPFVKGDESRGSNGTGLGLAIADNNLAMLGYKMELKSEQGEFRVMIKFKP